MTRHARAAMPRTRHARAATSAQGGLVASTLAAVESWLLEPAAPAHEPAELAPEAIAPALEPVALLPEPVAPTAAQPRPVVSVFGLARGCGATVVARALATELGLRDPSGSAAVHSSMHPGGVPLATRAAARLAHALRDVPGAGARAVGRLCLVDGADPMALAGSTRYFAPLVLDAGSASLAGPPASVPDRTVLVALPALEPALAAVASACLARLGPDPIVALNRAEGDDRWGRRADVQLPDSRIGARLALGGREPRGELGRAIADLAALVIGSG